jgi:hypothetical protein
MSVRRISSSRLLSVATPALCSLFPLSPPTISFVERRYWLTPPDKLAPLSPRSLTVSSHVVLRLDVGSDLRSALVALFVLALPTDSSLLLLHQCWVNSAASFHLRLNSPAREKECFARLWTSALPSAHIGRALQIKEMPESLV